jgi:hypothetical protein
MITRGEIGSPATNGRVVVFLAICGVFTPALAKHSNSFSLIAIVPKRLIVASRVLAAVSCLPISPSMPRDAPVTMAVFLSDVYDPLFEGVSSIHTPT